jgi:ribosomal protein S21
MATAQRKDNESFEGFLRRYKTYLQNSKKINLVRERRYLSKKENKEQKKKRALQRERIRNRNEYLRKTGKMSE